MLEAVQDILFSLNIISSLQKLRNDGIHSINGREFKSKETYSLRISSLDTFKLKDFINPNDCHKIEKIDSKPAPVCAEKASLGCFFSKDKDYIYFTDEDDESIMKLDPQEALHLHTALEKALFEGGFDG